MLGPRVSCIDKDSTRAFGNTLTYTFRLCFRWLDSIHIWKLCQHHFNSVSRLHHYYMLQAELVTLGDAALTEWPTCIFYDINAL